MSGMRGIGSMECEGTYEKKMKADRYHRAIARPQRLEAIIVDLQRKNLDRRIRCDHLHAKLMLANFFHQVLSSGSDGIAEL
jgi:hypothetical protein